MASSRETLEPTALEERLPQLSIVGDDAGGDSEGQEAKTGGGKRRVAAPMIVEISEDGSFELPDGDAGAREGEGEEEEEDDEEPPSLEGESASPGDSDGNADEPTLMDEMLAAANNARAEKKSKAHAEQKRVKKDFGKGLKGGFFNSKTKADRPKRKAGSKKASSTEKPIEMLKPQPQKKTADPLVLDAVQEAMSSSGGPMKEMLEKGEWMTPDLMQQFAQNPVLARGMSNPRMQQLIAALQKNPQATMAAVKNDPEAEAFMTEFCKTIGNHFTAMGAQNQEKVPAGPAPSAGPLADEAVKRAGEKAKSKTPPAPPSPEDEAQVQKVLQNEDVRTLLMDQEMQKVLMMCQQPGKLGEYMRHEKWGPKLRTLAEHGLIRIER